MKSCTLSSKKSSAKPVSVSCISLRRHLLCQRGAANLSFSTLFVPPPIAVGHRISQIRLLMTWRVCFCRQAQEVVLRKLRLPSWATSKEPWSETSRVQSERTTSSPFSRVSVKPGDSAERQHWSGCSTTTAR